MPFDKQFINLNGDRVSDSSPGQFLNVFLGHLPQGDKAVSPIMDPEEIRRDAAEHRLPFLIVQGQMGSGGRQDIGQGLPIVLPDLFGNQPGLRMEAGKIRGYDQDPPFGPQFFQRLADGGSQIL